MALAPTPPQQRPTMRHSSAFLLPPPCGGPADAATVALVVLNQPLPRFAPLLWSRGNRTAARLLPLKSSWLL